MKLQNMATLAQKLNSTMRINHDFAVEAELQAYDPTRPERAKSTRFV